MKGPLLIWPVLDQVPLVSDNPLTIETKANAHVTEFATATAIDGMTVDAKTGKIALDPNAFAKALRMRDLRSVQINRVLYRTATGKKPGTAMPFAVSVCVKAQDASERIAQMSFIASLPGGREIDTPCSTLDMLPTICGLVGEPVPDDRPIDGTDIWPIVSGQTTERDRGIPYRFLERKEQMFGAPSFAWIEGRWKFLTNLDAKGEHDQLYDMESDRGETKNVSADRPDLVIRCRAKLREFVESCRRSHAGGDYDEPVDMITPFQEPGGWSAGKP